jgi:predicted aldo/keto reductase-like oxidoreductase
MRFPEKNGKIDEALSSQMIKIAIDGGVNYFDSAYVYHGGKSEEFTGSVLGGYPRDSFYMATKLPTWAVKSLDDAQRIFGEQLSRLNMDYIDFYLLHALDKKKWANMRDLNIEKWGEELKRTGKIKYFGFSFHDDFECFEKIITAREWDFCQIQLNYMDIDENQGGLAAYRLCEKLGVPVIIMEPVKGGSLAKLPENLEKLFTAVNPEASPASWAIRWVGGLPGVKVILSGMSKAEQVYENLKTCGELKPLSDEEMSVVEKVRTERVKRVYNGCTGCNYCMPCPAGVNIPWNFTIWNNYGIYENRASANWDWGIISEGEKALNCNECGACEEQCPQKIAVREDLKKVQKQLDALKKKEGA